MLAETDAAHSVETPMLRSSTLFLQAVIVLIGIGALVFLLWEPHLEGRNAHATVFQVYFNDPFLAYAYIASVSFFVALFQALKLLTFARQSKVFSQAAVRALRTIRYCAIAIIGFVAGAEIFIMWSISDDRAGGVFMGILIAFGSLVAAAAAAMFELTLQNALNVKSQRDVTA
jgi:hypothetical protein